MTELEPKGGEFGQLTANYTGRTFDDESRGLSILPGTKPVSRGVFKNKLATCQGMS